MQNHLEISSKNKFRTPNMQNSTKTLISVMFYVFFGRIRAVVPNLSSAGFGRPSQVRVRPNSDGRAGSAGFELLGAKGQITQQKLFGISKTK